MVRKIQLSDYTKRYDNMSAEERQAFVGRVGEWLRSAGHALMHRADDFNALQQDVVPLSATWNDAECAAFEEGARLLSAMVARTDTWLPELLYRKSARRSIRQMVKVLTTVTEGEEVKADVSPRESPAEKEQVATQGAGEATSVKIEEPSKETPREMPADSRPAIGLPVRPKHIDQYVHLLPKKTQEHAAEVRELLRQLDDAREKARLLMGSAQASPDSRAQWAKKAVQLDNKLRSIYQELDTEWEKLVNDGRIAVDAFGNAHVVEADEGELKNGKSQDEGGKSLTSEQKARRRELRKWLIDLRRGAEGKAREKRIEQWKKNWKEYLTLESLEAALKDEKVVAAAEHFGFSLTALGENSGK